VKNKSIGRLILLAILAPSCGGGGGGGGGGGSSIIPPRWEETYRRPTSVDLRAVRFGNPSSGIVAGKFGTFVRTDDGGNTWHQLESTPVTVNGDILAMAVSNITTFAVGGTPPGAATYTGCMAWQSLDATTFVQPDSPQAFLAEPWVDLVLLSPASFTTAAGTLRLRPDGLLDVCQGSILATKDSTVNDTTLVPPPPPAAWTTANGVSLISTAYWLVCGNISGAGQIRRTSNAGTFFDTLTISPATPPLHRIGMISSTQGYAVGDGGTVIAVAPDPGHTLPLGDYWTTLASKPSFSQNLYALNFLDGNTGWVAGAGGVIYRITNAASSTPSWLLQNSATAEDLYDIYFVDPDHGFAVGNNGTIVTTSNGTAAVPTWTNMTTPVANPTPVFNAVDFTASGSIGLAVGNAGTLVRSLDAGVTWSPFNTGPGPAPLSANLTAVSIPRSGSNMVAFVGTDAGAVYFNNNISGAGVWQAAGTVTAPALSGIKALLFPKGDTAGIATGVGGTFANLTYSGPGSLTVAGATLSPAPGGTNYAAACDPTGNTLYIGGDAGYLVKSTDGGATWAAVAGGVGAPTGSIRALQAPTGPSFTLFAGVDDNIVHSLSSAGSWAGTAIAGFGTPASMAFTNDLNGWVLTQGATGGIRFTTDGGGTWLASVPHVPVDSPAHALNAIWMSPSGLGFIVGANGLIMRTTTGGK
jgi:photosystem II stability/assembly factor-like uncharacterized protein